MERARDAVAEAAGGYVIRCRVPDLGGRLPALSQAIGEPGDEIAGGVLTTIVGEPQGSKLLSPDRIRTAARATTRRGPTR